MVAGCGAAYEATMHDEGCTLVGVGRRFTAPPSSFCERVTARARRAISDRRFREMRVLAALLALACLALPCSALVVGRAAAPARPLAAGRALPRMMPSKEDKEFEEWVRKKKIASGVDPDEDFATGRAAESAIYQVGGAITILVPLIAGLWAYNEGYLTPQ